MEAELSTKAMKRFRILKDQLTFEMVVRLR
jgi:hypothetical protein